MNIANKVLLPLSFLLLLFTLAACEQTAQSHENNRIENEPSEEDSQMDSKEQNLSYSFMNPNTGQEFTIIHAYRLYENFFESVKDQPDESPDQLFQQEVVRPVFDACFKDTEYYRFSVFSWTPEEKDYSNLKSIIQAINPDHINSEFEESLIKSSDILPSDKKTTVCVFPKNENFPSNMITFGSGKITVFYTKPDLYYKSGMAHEYHHSVWTEKHITGDDNRTVLDAFIMEGEAVMFETIVYPELNTTSYVLDENYNKEYWSKIEPYLNSRTTLDFILGGSDGLPYNYGYSEGYKMIRSYLNLHPDMTVEEWTAKSPKEIVEKGNYMANYE